MVVSLLFHASTYRFGLTVLHHGGFHYCNNRRMAAIAAEAQGNFYCNRLPTKLFSWFNLYNTGMSYCRQIFVIEIISMKYSS